MAHREQQDFCKNMRTLYPLHFRNCRVLDVGSLDLNGSNRPLFERCQYTGIDIAPGPNVDVVSLGHQYSGKFDTIISTECFEHDTYYALTITNIVQMLVSGGLFLFTCAGLKRPEHETPEASPRDSPLTVLAWPEYYKNLCVHDIISVMNCDKVFTDYRFETARGGADLFFCGIKA